MLIGRTKSKRFGYASNFCNKRRDLMAFC